MYAVGVLLSVFCFVLFLLSWGVGVEPHRQDEVKARKHQSGC